jgi:Putative Flp pilus-assembly TadE/G-like
MTSYLLRGVDEERGGVLVMVVIWLPVILVMVVFVVDVGHWFVHKRHLQMQADSGALAGGGVFKFPCSDGPIEGTARNYAGDPNAPGPIYNELGAPTDPANVHVLINSDKFWNEGGVDGSSGTPCAASIVDVKITEADLPLFFGSVIPDFGVVPAINAHARVEIQKLYTAKGALPVAVPDVYPQSAKATFIDENTGQPLMCGPDVCSTPLTNTGFVDGLSIWDNAAAPLSVPISTDKIGVRVTLSGGSSTTCGDPLVECYDLADPGRGLIYVRGWSPTPLAGEAQPTPLARSVELFNGSCTDPYFTSGGSSCTIGVRANVDFGFADPLASPPAAKVRATVNGVTRSLTHVSGNLWQSAPADYFAVSGNAGPQPVTLEWEENAGQMTIEGRLETCKTGGGNKCKGTFGQVQRVFSSADAMSGPIKLAQLWEGGSFWANSFQTGTTHDLVVKAGVLGNLEAAQSVDDPIVSLRVVGGSQNQSLDCDPALAKLKDELAQGCTPLYSRNSGTPCPGNASVLWATPQPWPCVAVQTGTARNQVPAGLNKRILGEEKPASCTAPNNWAEFEDPGLDPTDPRIVQVFLTPFGSFTGSGSDTKPVMLFATFYVTGWTAQGGGFANPCQGNGDDPVPNNDEGVIVGHFINYVYTLNEGGGSGDLCDLNGFGTCVAVLTR